MYDVKEQLEAAGYKFEFEYGYYDYDWDETLVFTKDGHVFTLSDSGCSCSSYGEAWTNVHEAIGDMHEVTSLPDILTDYPKSWEPSVEVVRQKLYELGVR